MSILVILVVFPITFLAILGFIFQSTVVEIQNQQFLANCPLPLHKANATNLTIDGLNVLYDVSYGSDTSSITNTVFDCQVIDPDIPTYGANNILTTYTGSLINDQIAYFAWAGEYLSALGERTSHQIYIGWLFIDAPAQVSGFTFFSYISAISIGWFGLGIILIARGIG